MTYTLVKSYYPDGKWTGCEHTYREPNQAKALERFRSEYPEHKDCVCIATELDSEKDAEYINVALRCGCLH